MHERQDARSLGEAGRVGDAKLEARRGEGRDQLGGRPPPEIDDHIDIGAEAGHTMENRRPARRTRTTGRPGRPAPPGGRRGAQRRAAARKAPAARSMACFRTT